uniref:AMP-dependent synthetase/ligase domain-containing protein n=1 Tax=Kalanchoe fedtschenkoi TaxID=63787 RepID=A0A7N0TTB4_KALFE
MASSLPNFTFLRPSRPAHPRCSPISPSSISTRFDFNQHACCRIWSRLRVSCESQTVETQIRKCSPFLEKELLSSNGALPSNEWKAVPDIWRSSAEKYGDRVALVDPYHEPPTNMTYKQLEQEILNFCEGLRVMGIKADEKVGLFADNSCRWLVADQGIMATGAINVVRGSRSSNEELLQIYKHSESTALVADNPELLNRIGKTFLSNAEAKFIILLWGEKSGLTGDITDEVPVYQYEEITEMGRENRRRLLDSDDIREQYEYEPITSDAVATLVYTSGTTGNPKGVMLTHENILHQIRNLWDVVPAVPGDRFVSMLPPWHAYERACEYFTLTYGIEQVYTTVRNLKEDLQCYQPHYLISVPLVYQTLYSGIQKQISSSSTVRKLIALTFIKISLAYKEFKRIYEGKYLSKNQKQPPYFIAMLDLLWARVCALMLLPLHMLAKKLVYNKIHSAIGISKAGISGGGSLPSHVDRFFEAIDVTVQNGYGLTECSPVIAARRPYCNVLGSVGHPIRHTEFKVVNSETGEDLPAGAKGIVKCRGPQIMKGYYKNPVATDKVLDKDGWLDTGDVGWIAPHHSVGRSRMAGGVVVLEGREKDTIVLSTGENVEPESIEAAALRSTVIQQIVVIGQDQRRLGAVIFPNEEELLQAAKRMNMANSDTPNLSKEIKMSIVFEELKTW